MKIFKKLLLVSIFIVVIVALEYTIKDRHMDIVNVTYAPSQTKQLSQVKIGVIGDSWVYGKKLDRSITDKLHSLGVDVSVVSFGHPGANSRQILRDLLSDNSNPYSSHALLLDSDVSFLAIVAGVNDATGHMGKEFYTQHIKDIVSVVDSYSKIPIIVELPEFNIEETSGSYPSIAKHEIYKILFDDGKTDVISDYRDSLKTSLDESKLNYKLIPFTPIAEDYSASINLYSSPWHLNEEGSKRLGAYIGESISVELIKLRGR